MACVALPTCGLALAESERYLPSLVDALDEILVEAGLRRDEIVIRMTGCPNGCARPYLAEIGLVGRAPGSYHLYLGAAFDGTRQNKLYRRDVGHDQIVAELGPLLCAYAAQRRTASGLATSWYEPVSCPRPATDWTSTPPDCVGAQPARAAP